MVDRNTYVLDHHVHLSIDKMLNGSYSYKSSFAEDEIGKGGLELEIVGILTPKEGVSYGSVRSGVYYTEALTNYILEQNRNSEYIEYLGNKVVCHSIPIRPGRNLAVIVESAAVNFRQKKMGYNATEELYKRVQENMARNREDED